MDSTDEKDEEIKELRELVKILNQENQVLMEREHILQTEVITLHEILVAAQRHSAYLAQENHAIEERNATLGLKLSIDLLRKYPKDLQFPNEIRKPHPKKR